MHAGDAMRLEAVGLVGRVSSIAVDGVLANHAQWLTEFGELSWDHQSYYAGAYGRAAKALYYRNKWLGMVAVSPMVLSEALLPAARRLFHEPQRFPIADAHYAMGFALLAQMAGRREHLERAIHFLEVLESTRCPGYEGHGWGYPFDWVTRTGVMKAGTPLITTTPYVYEAFAAVYALAARAVAARSCGPLRSTRFHDIPDRELGPDEAAAGYNPLDTEGGVVNASAYRAFLLTEAAGRFRRARLLRGRRRNLNFVLRAQQADGSWPYADGRRAGFRRPLPHLLRAEGAGEDRAR